MAVLVTPIGSAGAITAPTSTPIRLPGADSLRWHPGLPVSTAKMPGEDLVLSVNGYDPMRHVYGGTYYRTGGLAPSAAGTATPSGAQATADMDLDATSTSTPYVLVNGDELWMTGIGGIVLVQFVTTLGPGQTPPTAPKFGAPLTFQIKVGGSNAATFARIQDVFDGNGTEGVDYQGYYVGTDPTTFGYTVSTYDDSAGTLTFQATDYGSGGNSLYAQLSDSTAPGSSNWTSQTSFGSTTTTIASTAAAATGVFSGGSDGSGSAPEAGTYRYLYTHVRTADGAETGPSPTFTATQGTAQNINVDGLAANGDSTFDFVRIYRTEDTGQEFFRVAEVASALSGNPDYADTTANGEDDYSLQGFGAAAYDSTAFLNYRGGFPPRGRVVTTWKGRAWTGGAVLAADYSAGTANVALDSASVTLSATAAPTESMVGDTFTVDSHSETYTIIAVAEDTRVLTLDRQYQGSNAPTATYTIKDLRDPTQIYCSEPNLPNQWPARNNPGSVDTDGDDEGITGMVPLDDALIIFTRTTMSRLTGDNLSSWQVHRVLGGEGCVAQATIQRVSLGGSTGLVWLSPNGIMLYGGSGAPVNLSSPSDEVGLDDTLDRINWTHAHLAHSRYSESERVVEMFVPLDNDVTPRNALVLDLGARTFSGPDRVADYTASGVLVNRDGMRYGVAGSRFGALLQLDLGQSDGGYGSFEPVQRLTTGATVRGVTRASGTDWPTTGDGLDWLPALVVYADGTYADTLIASNTDNDLVFAYDLATAPSSGDQVIVGAIHMIVETGRVMLSDGYDPITVKRLVVLHSPDSDGEYHPSVAVDQGALAVMSVEDDNRVGDFTDTTGREFFNFRKRGMLHKFALHVVEPGCSAAFIGYGYDADTREAR